MAEKKLKVVFHIDIDSKEMLKLALNNIKNFIQESELEKYEYEIVLISNYRSPLLFLRKNIEKDVLDTIKTLKEKRVEFLVCENSMRSLGIKKEELIDECLTIPSGVFKIAQLEKEGFSYIKP